MERCSVCGHVLSGSEWDEHQDEKGNVFRTIANTECDYCAHHENPKRLVALDKLSPKGEVHLRTLRARG